MGGYTEILDIDDALISQSSIMDRCYLCVRYQTAIAALSDSQTVNRVPGLLG